MIRLASRLFLGFFVLMFIVPSSISAAEPLRIFVSIAPQAWLAKKIGGERLDIGVLVEPGQDLHTFDPSPHQMARLAKAQAYFRIGVPFEKHLVERISATATDLRVVDTTAGLELRSLSPRELGSHGHNHGHDHAHGAGEPDPHIWLDPRLALAAADHMAQALQRLDPAHAARYARGMEELRSELLALHSKLADLLAPLQGEEMFVYHPAFGYFADAYGLTQVAVEVGGSEPGARRIADLIREAEKKEVRVLFVQPQFSRKSAEAIAQAIGARVVPLDPMARDYAANLLERAQTVRQALQEQQ